MAPVPVLDYQQYEEEEEEYDDEMSKHALYVNAAYDYHKNANSELVHRTLRSNNLEHIIDEQLSDSDSVFLVNHQNNELIQAIRGTQLNIRDLAHDTGIILNNPLFSKLFNTVHAMSFLNFENIKYIEPNYETRLLKSQVLDFPEEITVDLALRKKLETEVLDPIHINQLHTKIQITEYVEFLQELARETKEAIQNKIKPDISPDDLDNILTLLKDQIENIDNNNIMVIKKSLYSLVKSSVLSSIVGFALKYSYANRVANETKKLEQAQDKYKGYKTTIVSHSLGSIGNLIGREKGIKTVSFNPAPIVSDIKPHPDSVIYRTPYDQVSLFYDRIPSASYMFIGAGLGLLTGSPIAATGIGVISSLVGGEHNKESEKVIQVKKTNNLSHSLSNFYKKTKIQNEFNIPDKPIINLQQNSKPFTPQNTRRSQASDITPFAPQTTNFIKINRYDYDYDYIIPKKKKIKNKKLI